MGITASRKGRLVLNLSCRQHHWKSPKALPRAHPSSHPAEDPPGMGHCISAPCLLQVILEGSEPTGIPMPTGTHCCLALSHQVKGA